MEIEVDVPELTILVASVVLEGERLLKLGLPRAGNILELVVSNHLQVDLKSKAPLLKVILVAPKVVQSL